MDDLARRWEAFSVEAGIVKPKKEQERPNKFPWDQDRIQLGFNRLVAEIIYGDYGNDWLTERPYPHIIELMSDLTRLKELVEPWYEENYEAREEARNAGLGGVATRSGSVTR